MTRAAPSRCELTRFSASPAWAARLVVAAFLGLATYGVLLGHGAAAPAGDFLAQGAERSDGDLYRAIVARMADGAEYYGAAVEEHRARGYPLRPFVTVRLPTLAAILSRTGLAAGAVALVALLAAAAAGVSLRLAGSSRSRLVVVPGILLATVSAATLFDPALVVWHEVWAAGLIALSLACRTDRRWAASVAVGLAAVAVRELALPYLAVMASAAVLDGRRREATAWAGAAAVAFAAIAAHAAAVGAHVLPTDLASPGWAAAEGWRLPLLMIAKTGPLVVVPAPVVGIAVPLALLGWAGWPGSFGLRGAMLLAGYAAAFCVVGRVNTVYWGFLLEPLLLVGLVWAPAALRDLALSAAGRSRVPLAA